MEYEKIKFSKIIPSDYNPRVMSKEEHDKLSNNLEKFGLVDPIIINLKNMHIIGGHQRYSVLKEKYGNDVDFEDPELNIIKLGDIGWIFLDENLKIKDETHEKALNLALNKISGEWDYTKLPNILDDLNKTHFNMDLTGFDQFEIEQFVIPEMDIPTTTVSEKTDENINETSNEINESDNEVENEKIIEINDDKDEEVIGESDNDTNENYDDEIDEVDVSEIESFKDNSIFKCPKCGYEW